MMLRRYRDVLRRPHVPRLVAAMVMNGVSTGLPLAIILSVRVAGGFAAAGGAAAAFAISAAISNPFRGRWVDRLGQRTVLLGLNFARAAALGGLALAVSLRAPVAVLVLCSAASGAANPPVASSMRAMWRSLMGEGQDLTSAYALQSVANELTYVLGPVAASLLIAGTGGPLALLIIVGIELAGTLLFVGTPASRVWREGGATSGLWGAMSSAGFRVLALVNIPIGMTFGCFDVAAPGLAVRHGQAWAAGFAMGALAVGSMIGGLVYGAREWRAHLHQRFLVLLVLLCAGFFPLALVHSVPALIVTSAIAGLALAPAVASVFSLIDDVAPEGTGTEALTWIMALYALGTALGAALAGRLVTNHLQLVLAGGTICAGLAAVVAAAGIRTLRPRVRAITSVA